MADLNCSIAKVKEKFGFKVVLRALFESQISPKPLISARKKYYLPFNNIFISSLPKFQIFKINIKDFTDISNQSSSKKSRAFFFQLLSKIKPQ